MILAIFISKITDEIHLKIGYPATQLHLMDHRIPNVPFMHPDKSKVPFTGENHILSVKPPHISDAKKKNYFWATHIFLA